MTDLTDLLGGAVRTATRERGFAPWKPQKATRDLLAQVQAVLTEYRQYLPLTARQIFYRLVGSHGYAKTEQAYDNLCEKLNRARRAGMIPFSAIRDDGNTALEPQAWNGADEFMTAVRRQAAKLLLDRTEGQKVRLVVFCEAGGMAPMLAQVANPYGVPVFSGGGFDSVTAKHDFANQLTDHDRPTMVLHIGDHDPSGAHLYLAFSEDVEAFADDLGGEVSFHRLAVIPRQIAELGLPTAPPKETDKRAFNGETCQAEAIAPDDLAGILRDAIVFRMDMDVYEAVLRREHEVREELRERLGETE